MNTAYYMRSRIAKICAACDKVFIHPLDGEVCCQLLLHPEFQEPCPAMWRSTKECPLGKWKRDGAH